MKPIPVAPLTREDDLIWWDLDEAVPGDRYDLVSEICRESDRRDAALMLAWSRGWPIDLGGADENGECLFWTLPHPDRRRQWLP